MVNQIIQDLYGKFSNLLSISDNAFIEEGPTLLKHIFEEQGLEKLMAGIRYKYPQDGYTRTKLIGEKGKQVIRFMEWPFSYYLHPHEHHGRPCFEILIYGKLEVIDFKPVEVGEGRYKLDFFKRDVLNPGQVGIIDPRITEVHSVRSLKKSGSLHVYPSDENYTTAYIFIHKELYGKERFELKD